MVAIDDIINSIKAKKIKITEHADGEAQNDELSFEEVFASVLTGEIIEKYPDDKPYPSCLIYGKNLTNEPIHSVWVYNAETKAGVLITVYRPDPSRWINWKIRRK